MKEDFLAMLRCPITRQKLRLASQEELEQARRKQSQGELKFASGDPVSYEVSGLLIREDTQMAYPIREEIPVLLREASLSWPI